MYIEWFKFINKYNYKPWNWKYISKNPNVTIEIFEKYQNKLWDYNLKFPDKEWDWDSISKLI